MKFERLRPHRLLSYLPLLAILPVCGLLSVACAQDETTAVMMETTTTETVTSQPMETKDSLPLPEVNPLNVLEQEASKAENLSRQTDALTTRSQFSNESSMDDALFAEPAPEPLIHPGVAVDVSEKPLLTTDVLGLDALPKQLDKSTTNAQLMQLEESERKGQIGEAYLMAYQLMLQFPYDEYAYDAAIRNSLKLGPQMAASTEQLFKDAMRRVDSPGKYYVQYAHLLQRQGKTAQLQELYADYGRDHAEDPECTTTLARIATIADTPQHTTIELLEAARSDVANPFTFSMLQLLLNAYEHEKQYEKMRALCIDTIDMDYGPWDKKTLFNAFLKIPGIETDEILTMLRQVLSNEQDYRTARAIAGKIIEQALNHRFIEQLTNRLDERIERNEANHIEVWLAALLAQMKHDNTRVRTLLIETSKSTTPVIAYERAMFLRQAGEYPQAIEIFQVLMEEQWDNTDIRMNLAELYLLTNKPLEAAELLDDMSTLWVSRDALRRAGTLAVKAAMRLDNPQYLMDTWISQSSIAQFSDILSMGDEVVRELGETENIDELISQIETRLKQPDSWSLYLLKARLHTIKGDQRASLESYLAYLTHDPDNIMMTQHVAQLASLAGSTNIELTENDGKIQIPIRATNTANTDIAIDLYKRLIEKQPMIAENYSALMRVYQARGEVEKAKRVALELSDYETSIPLANSMAAEILADNGFAKDSLPLFERYLSSNRENISVWMRFAQALGDAGQYSSATAIYHKLLLEGVLGRAVNQPSILANLLAIAKKNNTIDELTQFLVAQRNVKLPSRPEYLLSSAKLLMQLDKMDDATTMIAAFQTDFPEHRLAADSLLLLGQVAEAKGRPDQALTLFNAVATGRYTAGTTAEIQARFEIGDLKRKQGDFRGAIATWVDSKARFPENNKAIEGLYDAGMLAWFELKDVVWSKALLNEFITAGSTDFNMVNRGQHALDALNRNTSAEDYKKILATLKD